MPSTGDSGPRPIKAVVATAATLESLAGSEDLSLWMKDPSGALEGDYSTVEVGDVICVVSANDQLASRVVVLQLHEDGSLLGQNAKDRLYGPVLERISQFCTRARSIPVQVPHGWGLWQANNRYAFAAAAYSQTPQGLRCIALVESNERTVLVARFYNRRDNVDVADVAIDEQILRDGVGSWGSAWNEAQKTLSSMEDRRTRRQILIESPSGESRTDFRNYDQWLPLLTEGQRKFLYNDETPSLNLRGPAGSGKTLTLQLKALREAYAGLAAGNSPKIVFATHSWASADQVDKDLRRLDTGHGYSCIDVVPLSGLADSVTPQGSWRPDGMELLGEDSLTSKRLQLQLIDNILTEFEERDWFTYRASATPEFAERIENDAPKDRQEFLGDLLGEFGCVLAAENIFRGWDAETRYLDLRRGQWTMPLNSSNDRKIVFALYQLYLAELRANSFVTTDLLMSEFFRHLRGGAWDLQREHEGFDLVVVDEVHLFNVQERMALRSLMRDPMAYARVCAAFDLRQSPKVRSLNPAESESDSESIELTSVHRYSPEILSFVSHIHDYYPELGLGDAWALDLDQAQSSAEHGPKPVVHTVTGYRDAALVACFARANELQKSEGQTAILVLDDSCFDEYVKFANESSSQMLVIAGRDDLISIQHSKRSLVVGLAEHVAGLQFDKVLVAEMPDDLRGEPGPAYREREAFTLLYLAASRAQTRLEIFVDSEGAMPSVLSEAARRGVVVKVP